MQFTTQQHKLVKILNNLVRNTDSKFPMFANIEIRCINDKLKLSASNGKVTIHETLDALIQENTPVAVPAQKFFDIVSKLDGSINFNDGLIQCGKHKLKLPIITELLLPETEFNCQMIQIDIKELKQALKGRLYACAKFDNTILSGVCLNIDEIVSTDGSVMSIYNLKNALPFAENILDNKLANEIIKTFDEEKIELGLDHAKVIVKSENTTLIGMLLNGNYPKYKQLIPTPLYKVKLDKAELLKVLEIARLMVDEKRNTCYFNFDDNKLIIGTKDGSSEIDIEYKNEPMKIWLNVNFVIECLKNTLYETIEFGFTNPLSACIIETDNEKTLIMPIKN